MCIWKNFNKLRSNSYPLLFFSLLKGVALHPFNHSLEHVPINVVNCHETTLIRFLNIDVFDCNDDILHILPC